MVEHILGKTRMLRITVKHVEPHAVEGRQHEVQHREEYRLESARTKGACHGWQDRPSVRELAHLVPWHGRGIPCRFGKALLDGRRRVSADEAVIVELDCVHGEDGGGLRVDDARNPSPIGNGYGASGPGLALWEPISAHT